ncbi:carboxylesterase family protein [Chitinophaga japonensis]|uniref:Putative esterase n=1 Tax=Chitinophaga japonensis TaxID=104662 RepID=A0A562SUY5_CHIJA|nr:alpha/beta hydrolase-fold protein [Chitinophaga japonensis]TWI84516.1 putative esterase [Chitinophaga japonensis]
MMKKCTLLLWTLLLGYGLSYGQERYVFNKGLISGPCHQYGRQAVFTDPLAWLLHGGQLPAPAENGLIPGAHSEQPLHWQGITADHAGVFSGRAMNNGYLYLSYESPAARTALLNISGHQMVYVNGVPHAGDIYRYGWMYIPVELKKGLNQFYVRTGRSWGRYGVQAQLLFPQQPVYISKADSTMPFIVTGQANDSLWGAVVIINTTNRALKGLHLKADIGGRELTTALPDISPMTTRKVGFRMDARSIQQKGGADCHLQLLNGRKAIDEQTLALQVVQPDEHYSSTFVSNIDGSVQYYSVSPQVPATGKAPALFLSVHGAEVQAINQARAYVQKDWGVLVAPTNRRPRGFNWEDWGRLDALEVLEQAQQTFQPDPERIYLTGHSMGGHGTWYLGATYPGKWAAIAPCSGYPTLLGYGSADGLIPDSPRNSTEKTLLRASNPSNVVQLAHNYKAGGVYVLHGDSDKVVSVKYARQMKQVLASFHADYSYYEYPGGEHWYGNQCVDWPPLFQYFKWHTITPDSAYNNIDFTTANPAISTGLRWAHILQQQHSLEYSRIQLSRSADRRSITGTTGNVQTLALVLKDVPLGATVSIQLDGEAPVRYTKQTADTLYLHHKGQWTAGAAPPAREKGAQRGGTLKEAFNHRMVFVYGTSGTKDENEWAYNKARYDAETWYYRGNGAVDLVADKDFDATAYPDQGIILYGHANSNKAWAALLQDCPIQVSRGRLRAGERQYHGGALAAYFVWPRADSKIASIAVISGTGMTGLHAAEANQYFAGGSGFPDYMIFSADLLKGDINAVKAAGFYSNQWEIEN